MMNGNIPNSLNCVRKLMKTHIKHSFTLNFDRNPSSKFKIMQTNHNDYSNNLIDTYLSRFVVVCWKIKIHLTYVYISTLLLIWANHPGQTTRGGENFKYFQFQGDKLLLYLVEEVLPPRMCQEKWVRLLPWSGPEQVTGIFGENTFLAIWFGRHW